MGDIKIKDLDLAGVKNLLSQLNDRVDELEKQPIKSNSIDDLVKEARNNLPYLERYTNDELFDIFISNDEYIDIEALQRIIYNNEHYKALAGRKVKVNLKDNTELDFLILNENYDIICITPFHEMEFSDKDNIYKTSKVREWLNNDFIKLLPDTILSCLSKMKVESNDEILEDYVTIPSMSELGKSSEYYDIKDEGSVYELLNSNIFRKWIWTRSRHTGNTLYVWIVYADGHVNDPIYSSFYCLAPVIRLG